MNSSTRGALAAIAATLIVCVGSARGQMMGYAPQPGYGYGYGGGQQPLYREASPQGGPQYVPTQMVSNGAPSDPAYQMPPGASGEPGAPPSGGDGGPEGEGVSPGLPPGTCYCPRWTATTDALWLTRWGGHSEPLLVGSAGADLLNTTGLPFNIAGGPRADLIYHSNSKWELEFSGFLIDGFHARDAEADPGLVNFLNAGISAQSPVMEFDYTSRLYSAECNLRRPVGDNLTMFLGARWVELEENLTGLGMSVPFISVNTNNHMYGLQAGADATLWTPTASSPFRIDALAKGGVYEDRGDQNSSGTLASGATATAGSFDDHVAFLGEASLTACYQLSKHVAARVGCQTMWMQSVALAPNQLMTTNLSLAVPTAKVDMSGGLFYIGGFGSLEVDY